MSPQEPAYATYGGLGAVAGILVATVYWVGVGPVWWWGLICELAGSALGAVLGAVSGDGSVKKVWAGPVGAFLIPLISLALAGLALTVVAAAHSG